MSCFSSLSSSSSGDSFSWNPHGNHPFEADMEIEQGSKDAIPDMMEQGSGGGGLAVERAVECSICMEKFEHPKLLKCMHT